MKFHLVNLGCKVNAAETESIELQLRSAGLLPGEMTESQVAVINTCTVTKRADDKSLYQIRKALRQPGMKHVFVTGCYSELERDLSVKTPGIRLVIPQNRKHEAGRIILDAIGAESAPNEGADASPDALFRHHALYQGSRQNEESLANRQDLFFDHARAFVKIQDGCNNFCTFCRIPFARGFPASRAADDILEQVANLARKGYAEIVLTGINMGLYRHKGLGFTALVQAILDACGPMKVRISSVEPQSLDPRFVEILAHEKMVPHLHLPLQAGTDRILDRMNRLYTTAEFADLVEAMRRSRPDLALSTDVITGFPGETEQEMLATEGFCRRMAFMKIHAFPFSARPLAKAGAYDEQIQPSEKKRRNDRLSALSDELHARWVEKMGGRSQRFILESEPKDGLADGTSDYYIKGTLEIPAGSGLVRGAAVQARATSFDPIRFEIAG